MKGLSVTVLSMCLFAGSAAFAGKHDGSKIPECQGVTDVCMKAKTPEDAKDGNKDGYQPGAHKAFGDGLWADCVGKLAKGEEVPGVSGVSKEKAQACLDAKKKHHAGKHGKGKKGEKGEKAEGSDAAEKAAE